MSKREVIPDFFENGQQESFLLFVYRKQRMINPG